MNTAGTVTTDSSDTKLRLAFVQSTWHNEIVNQARDGFLDTVGQVDAEVELFEVPGAFELPLHARTLAMTGRFDAIVAAGFVVDGGIYRHEFVAEAVISGLMKVQLEVGVPVFSSVLTPQQFADDTKDRAFFMEHMTGKGEEVAAACLTTLAARAAIAA